MGVLTGPYGQLMSGVTTNTPSADSIQVSDATAILFQIVESAAGTCSVALEQQLPGATTWGVRATYAISANEIQMATLDVPVGLVRVRTLSMSGATIAVFYGAHYPR